MLLGQSVSGKLTEILVKVGFNNNLRTYPWGPRNRVFLRKYFLQAMAAEEPGEVAGSARARSLLGRFYARRGQFVQAKALLSS